MSKEKYIGEAALKDKPGKKLTLVIKDGSVTTPKIADENVTTEKMADEAITTPKVADQAITDSKLGDNAVVERAINEGAVTTPKIASGAVETDKIADENVTNEKLAEDSVTTDKIKDESVTEDKLAESSVGTSKIKDGAVTNDKVANDSLTRDKLDPELRNTLDAATGLPEDLMETIQNVDKTLKDHQSQLDDKQSQIDDKQKQITANDEDISLLQTRSTQMEEAIKDISASGGASVASAVTYDNTESGLDSITAQGAIDELANKKFDKESVAQGFGESEDKVVSQFALPFREIESPEFLHCIVDAEDHFLFGIQLDGSIEWGKGIPAPIRAKLQEIINQCQQDKTDILEAINAAKEELSASITALQEGKVDKEEGKSLIDNEVKECFRVIENEEFIKAIVDAEDKVLFGFYRATGKPYYPLNEMYHVEQNEEFFALWLDAANHVLLGIRRDGQIIGEIHAVNALKQVVSALQEKVDTMDSSLKELLDVFNLQDNEEYLAVEKDAEGKILSTTNPDGSHYIHNVKSETIPEEFEHIEDPEGRTEITTDAEDRILAYRDSDGVRHESGMEIEQFYQKGNKIEYATKSYVDTKPIDDSDIKLSKLDGVVDCSLKNLFDKNKIRTYDSDFATKVFNAIGRKTGDTGCYSNNIPCKEGDWFTRNDFGTGIVVVLDKNDNILGDVKNVAYKPTFQIKASENQDFSKAVSVVMVVMLNALDTERIVNAKYVPTKEEDAIRIPKLKIGQENIELGITTYVKGSSGRYYSINVEDLEGSPQISLVKLGGIPSSELPSDFPKFTISGSFSDYYKSLVLCPIEGGTEYLFELGTNGLVSRYLNKKVNCPRLIKENGVQYYYGVDGALNLSSGELNIYKAKDETFELVKGNIRDSEGNMIEPHDCLVLSVNPLHVITQRYVGNQRTLVDGEEKVVTSLHVEEQYDGKRVWLWKSEDYPELWKDSHYKGNNQDYLHNNTICIDKDNNLVLNNKHANQILVISRTWSDDTHIGTIGDILWKIGGNRGDNYNYDVATRIKTTSQQQWFECHDAVVNSEGLYTLFDNKESGASRIVEFNIDTENKSVKNFNSFTYKSYSGRYMGSVDKLANGIFLVSWGSFRSAGTPNIGIYDFKNGNKIFEMKMDSDSYSVYRVYGIRK